MNQHPQHRLVFPDEGDTIAYGSGRAWKKWAVHLVAGPARKPVYKKTVYVRTRTAEAARAVASVVDGVNFVESEREQHHHLWEP